MSMLWWAPEEEEGPVSCTWAVPTHSTVAHTPTTCLYSWVHTCMPHQMYVWNASPPNTLMEGGHHKRANVNTHISYRRNVSTAVCMAMHVRHYLKVRSGEGVCDTQPLVCWEHSAWYTGSAHHIMDVHTTHMKNSQSLAPLNPLHKIQFSPENDTLAWASLHTQSQPAAHWEHSVW